MTSGRVTTEVFYKPKGGPLSTAEMDVSRSGNRAGQAGLSRAKTGSG